MTDITTEKKRATIADIMERLGEIDVVISNADEAIERLDPGGMRVALTQLAEQQQKMAQALAGATSRLQAVEQRLAGSVSVDAHMQTVERLIALLHQPPAAADPPKPAAPRTYEVRHPDMDALHGPPGDGEA